MAMGGMKPAMAQNWRPGHDKDGEGEGSSEDEAGGGTVSLRAEVPEPLLRAMGQFIECHPNWDQYRLFQAALAGFLVQNGVQNRGVTRCYLANLFPGSTGFDPLPASHEQGSSAPLPRRELPRAERPWSSEWRGGSRRRAA
jgi:hypothetical protein